LSDVASVYVVIKHSTAAAATTANTATITNINKLLKNISLSIGLHETKNTYKIHNVSLKLSGTRHVKFLAPAIHL